MLLLFFSKLISPPYGYCVCGKESEQHAVTVVSVVVVVVAIVVYIPEFAGAVS